MGDTMDIDMDIDMDIELDLDIPIEEDLSAPQADITSSTSNIHQVNTAAAQPNCASEPDALKPQHTKIHLKGLDNLKSDDIKAFAKQYYPQEIVQRVEWIDDSSANLIYSTEQVARSALNAFAAQEIDDVAELPILHMIVTKPFPDHPETRLEARLALIGDKKQAGARDRSRFYLMNPEYDPALRNKDGARGGRGAGQRRYRDRAEEGEYRSHRYDNREQRRREEVEQFDVSLYDDDEETLAARAAKRASSLSSDDRGVTYRASRRRSSSPKRPSGDLFPGKKADTRLRQRSASPTRDSSSGGLRSDAILAARKTRNDKASLGNHKQAQAVRDTLRKEAAQKELFPRKKTTNSTTIFDVTDEATSLLASTGFDGTNDLIPTYNKSKSTNGMSIKGKGNAKPDLIRGGLSIKGSGATTQSTKELFPSLKSGNSGKELLSHRLDGRGAQRNRAEDLFR